MRAGWVAMALAGCVAPVPDEPVDTGTPALGYWDTTCRRVSQLNLRPDGTVSTETYWTYRAVPGVGMYVQEDEFYDGMARVPYGQLFDLQGRLLHTGGYSWQYDAAGDLVYELGYPEAGAFGDFAKRYVYDAHHNLIQVDTWREVGPSWNRGPPDNQSFFRNSYDAEDHLVLYEECDTAAGPCTVINGWEYDADGLLTLFYENDLYYAPEYFEYGYDDQRHLSWMEIQDVRRRCLTLYTYDTDEAGNILEERIHAGCDPTDPVTYLQQQTWDAEGRRLTEYTEDFAGLGVGPNYLYTWTYDERGNLTSERYDRLSAPAPIDDRYTTWTWECP